MDTCCCHSCRSFQAIAVQRPGMKQFLADGEGIEGYEILVDDK